MTLVILALTLLMVKAASAAGTAAFSPQLFRPNIDGKGLIITEGASTLRQGKASGGLFVNYTKDPLVAKIGPGARSGVVVNRVVTGDLVGAFGITQLVSIGVHVPVLLNQEAPFGAANKVAFNDVSLWGKGAILTEEGGPFSLSAVGRFKFPTGSAGEFTGDDRWGGELTGILERHIGKVHTTANIGYRLRNKEVEYLLFSFRDEILFGLGAGVPENTRFYSVEFNGSTPATDAFQEQETPIEVLAGAKQAFAGRFSVETGIGRGLTHGYGSPSFRVFLGFRFTQDVAEHEEPRL